MIAFVDVHYPGTGAVSACVLAEDWLDAEPTAELVEVIPSVEPYEAGCFFRRELPCVLAVLARTLSPVDVIVVDGYVWLGDATLPGMGAHLFDALGRTTPVVGIAKTRYLSAVTAREVIRGSSRRPLYVTAAGLDSDAVARSVLEMHGPFRIPTLVRRADQICRRPIAAR